MEKPELTEFTVKEGDHEMTVVIPKSGDKSYDDYLEEAEREKTRDELRKKPPKARPTVRNEELAGKMREVMEFKKRKKEGTKRFY